MKSFLLTGLGRLKMHKSWTIIKILKGSKSEKIAIGTAKRAIRAKKTITHAVFEAVRRSKK